MSKALDSQRTYALIGTGGCGKTSLAEMLLFQSGVINRLGAIEEGTTTLDYEPEEIKRRGSIQPGFATFLWNKDRHFLMDVPGDTNFTGDLPYLLMGVDAAVLVIDAVDGVRPLTRRIWNAVREAGLPSFVFINKMDRDRADFDMAFNGLSSVLGMKPVTLYMPVMTDGVFTGVVDILGGKALMFGENGAVTEALIPDAIADEAALLHDTTVENIAESDEELMEKYLEEGSLSEEDLASGLRKGVLNASLVPVVVGSSLENKGGRELLDAIARLFPSPLERPAFLDADGNERASSDEGPACGFVFKTIADPFSGQLNMVRVISGTISSESTLKNMRTEESERLGTLLYLDGKTQTPCKDVLGPGAIIAVGKLKNTRTGDTLSDDKAPFAVAMPQLAPQLITFALAPKEKGDEDKVYAAVQKLLDEDVTLKLSRDEESGFRAWASSTSKPPSSAPNAATRWKSCSRRPRSPTVKPFAARYRCKAATRSRAADAASSATAGSKWKACRAVPATCSKTPSSAAPSRATTSPPSTRAFRKARPAASSPAARSWTSRSASMTAATTRSTPRKWPSRWPVRWPSRKPSSP